MFLHLKNILTADELAHARSLLGETVVARVAHGTARALQLFFVAAGLGFAE